MEFNIQHRCTGRVLHKVEADSLAEAVEALVREGRSLAWADLKGAKLVGASIPGACLMGADLKDANLSNVDLREANLTSSDCTRAYFWGADLRKAKVGDACFSDASFVGADLRETSLRKAYIAGADFHGAETGSPGGLNMYLLSPLALLLDQAGTLRAYKLVTQYGEGPYFGGIRYKVGKVYNADRPKLRSLKATWGIHLASLGWCLRKWGPGYKIMVAEFNAADILGVPSTMEETIRVSRCKIIGERDVSNLMKEEDAWHVK